MGTFHVQLADDRTLDEQEQQLRAWWQDHGGIEVPPENADDEHVTAVIIWEDLENRRGKLRVLAFERPPDD